VKAGSAFEVTPGRGLHRRGPLQRCSPSSASPQLSEACVRQRVHHADERLADAALLDLGGSGFAHLDHFQIEAQCKTGQRMVSVEHDVRRIDLGDGVERLRVQPFDIDAFRRAVELHADVQALWKLRLVGKENERRVVVAERHVGLEVELHFEAFFLAGQGLLDLGQQVSVAVEEVDRLPQFVDQISEGVLESPRQADDAWFSDKH
jgi:hypothetical protein